MAAFFEGLARLAAADEVQGVGNLVVGLSCVAISEELAGPAGAWTRGAFSVGELGNGFEPFFLFEGSEEGDAVLAAGERGRCGISAMLK